jgi:hypothetical protein
LSVSELISDSPSELAFIVGHELGHVAQAQHGATLSIANAEQDADLFAVTLMILAGFDSYGGAGALAKLNLVTGNAGLLAPTFDDLPDPRASFTARLNSMFSILNQACALPAVSGACGAEKIVSHPHLPSAAPF